MTANGGGGASPVCFWVQDLSDVVQWEKNSLSALW